MIQDLHNAAISNLKMLARNNEPAIIKSGLWRWHWNLYKTQTSFTTDGIPIRFHYNIIPAAYHASGALRADYLS